MARTGLFGRQPRVAPTLTSTLVSLAREQQNQEDQNISDAWQKGGFYEGKKVTDQLVLDHWRGRLKDISKQDPLYDLYSNTVTQFEYAIAESKMTVKFAQGKISDKQAADFYLGWAKKIPQDSEFYRVLQRDAAQHMNAAKNKADATAKQAQETAYQNGQVALQNKYGAAGNYLTEVLTNVAVGKGIIQAGQNFGNFDLSDPGVMLSVFGELNGGAAQTQAGEYRPQQAGGQVLYKDPRDGHLVTAGEVQAKLHQLDPHYNGTVTPDYFAQVLRNQSTGLELQLANAQKTGHAVDASKIMQAQTATTAIATNLAAWPIEDSYRKANDTFMSTWGDVHATPQEKLAAWSVYSQTLSSLAVKSKDPALSAILTAEVNGNPNIETLKTQMGGLDQTTGKTTGVGDGAATFKSVEELQKQVADVASQEAVWTLGGYVNGKFVPGAGTVTGAAPIQDIRAISSGNPITVTMPSKGGLAPITVYVVGKDIHAAATTVNGDPIPTTTANGAVVGQSYNLPDGTLVGVKGSNGVSTFTMNPPWAQGVVQQQNSDGSITLHIQNVVPSANNPTFATTGNTASGAPIYGITNVGALVVDPARAMSPNPLTDANSPTVAYNIATIGQQGLAQMVDRNPDVAQSIDEQNRFYTGQQPQIDPQTGGITGWTGGDQTAYNNAAFASNNLTGQTRMADREGDNPAALTQALSPKSSWSAYGPGLMSIPQSPYLPKAEGRPDFSILATMTPNNPMVPSIAAPPGLVPPITTGGGLKVPSYPTQSPTGTYAPTPATYNAPSPTTGTTTTPQPQNITGQTAPVKTPYTADPTATYNDAANKYGPGY